MPPVDPANPPDPLGPPPANFNREWAEFCVKYAEAHKRNPLEGLGSLVAVLSSLAALAISGINAWHINQDRAEATRKEALAGQISVAKLYFDKLPTGDACNSRTDRQLFVKTAVTMAGFNYDDLANQYLADATLKSVKYDDDMKALQSLAVVLFLDVNAQLRPCDVGITVPNSNAKVVRVETANEGTTYAFREQIKTPTAQVPMTPETKPTVYIQFKRGDSAAQQRATDLQAKLLSAGYKTPGMEAVANTPTADQLRIYKTDDVQKAKDMLTTIPTLSNAQIVDLQKAYPKLPSGIMEVWLGSP
jgi:hypothetical protein